MSLRYRLQSRKFTFDGSVNTQKVSFFSYEGDVLKGIEKMRSVLHSKGIRTEYEGQK
jgi:hypothetical protein